MSVTPNFNWPLIEPTDFVTNLPADFEAFADDVDADVYALDQAAIKKTIFDAKGDLLSATADDTPARLAVGTNGFVLTADSTESTGLKWAAVPSSLSITLLSTTSLSGSTVTVSGIDQGYKHLFVEIANLTISGGGGFVRFQPNGNNFDEHIFGSTGTRGTPSNAGSIMGNSTSGAVAYFSATIFNYASTTENKNCQYLTTFGASVEGGGFIKSNTEITTLTVNVSANTFSAGTLRIYGVK